MATLSPVSATTDQSRQHMTLARRSIVAFFGLAYLWTWGLIGIAVLGVTAGALAEDGPAVALLAGAAPFGPAAAALLVAARAEGRAGVRRLLGGLDPRRTSLRWYTGALFGPPLGVLLGATLVYGTAPLAALADQWPILVTRYLPYTLTVALLGTGFAEELGWRGLAQPRLQQCYGPLGASLALGGLAALWHLPNALLGPGGLAGFALQALYTVAVALLFTWAFNRTGGSVLIVALLHAALNTSGRLLSALVPVDDIAQFQQTVVWIGVVVVSLAGALLVWGTRGRLGLTHDDVRDA